MGWGSSLHGGSSRMALAVCLKELARTISRYFSPVLFSGEELCSDCQKFTGVFQDPSFPSYEAVLCGLFGMAGRIKADKFSWWRSSSKRSCCEFFDWVDLEIVAKSLDLAIKPNARKSEFYQEDVFGLSEKGLVFESLVKSLEDSLVSERSFAEESIEVTKLRMEAERLNIKHRYELDIFDRETQAKLSLAEARYTEAQAKALEEGQNSSPHKSPVANKARAFSSPFPR